MKTDRILTFLVALMLLLSACAPTSNAAQADFALPNKTTPTNTPSSASVGQTPALAPGASVGNLTYTPASPTSPAMMSSTPVPPTILVSAAKGNVFIRRGPDLAYNAISVLMDGQSARALARDVLAKWVQIPIPGHPKETGWISIQTRFVAVSGNVMELTEVIPTNWPVLASIRNCTRHYMEVNPGSIIIPAVYDFPENDVQINPGVYTIHDIEVDGSPEVMEVEVKEGLQIDIIYDGDGDRKKCPLP
jgi:hypothetical protein